MKKFLFVLCLALLLTLICTSALAAEYTSNGKLFSSITEVNGKAVDPAKPMTVTERIITSARIIDNAFFIVFASFQIFILPVL